MWNHVLAVLHIPVLNSYTRHHAQVVPLQSMVLKDSWGLFPAHHVEQGESWLGDVRCAMHGLQFGFKPTYSSFETVRHEISRDILRPSVVERILHCQAVVMPLDLVFRPLREAEDLCQEEDAFGIFRLSLYKQSVAKAACSWTIPSIVIEHRDQETPEDHMHRVSVSVSDISTAVYSIRLTDTGHHTTYM